MEILVEFDNYIRGYFTGNDPLPTYWPDHVIPELKADIKTILLNQNYRSTPEILNASNSLIAKNKNRIEKELHTENPNGAAVEHFHGKKDTAEIKYIADKIKNHADSGGKYSDIAILYRSAYVSRFIEQGLLKNNIPYVVYGGVGFYERREIKDVLSYLRLVANGDDLSFNRVINVPRRKMGKNKIAFLKERAESENASLYDILKKYLDSPVLKGSGAEKFVRVIDSMKEYAETAQVSELLQRLLIETGYEKYIRESGEMERLDNVSELIRSIVALETEHGETLTLPVFLQEISLNRDIDEDENEKKDCVKIMTTHIAKGLEFHTVIVAGLSEKIFPSARSLEERREKALEEERRLCYVAMTRAKKQLFMTESEGFGIKGYMKTPSRFLFDISSEYITRIGNIDKEIMAEHELQTIIRKSSVKAQYPVGTMVKHKAFGEGVVEDVNFNTQTYLVRFLAGTKSIRFDYKNLWKLF
jgi:DNA helicase-2/ATP-dependent DNA helicase PcrA